MEFKNQYGVGVIIQQNALYLQFIDKVPLAYLNTFDGESDNAVF